MSKLRITFKQVVKKIIGIYTSKKIITIAVRFNKKENPVGIPEIKFQ